METGREEVLTNSYDVRGPQSRILRLYHFDKEGFLHMLFYRILIFISIVTAVYLFAYLIDNSLNITILYTLIIFVWILLTPQIFESAKVFSITQTHAKIFGHLEESFLKSSENQISMAKRIFYWTIPYFALSIWILGLILYIFKVLL